MTGVCIQCVQLFWASEESAGWEWCDRFWELWQLHERESSGSVGCGLFVTGLCGRIWSLTPKTFCCEYFKNEARYSCGYYLKQIGSHKLLIICCSCRYWLTTGTYWNRISNCHPRGIPFATIRMIPACWIFVFYYGYRVRVNACAIFLSFDMVKIS